MLVQIKSGSDGLNLQQYQQVYFVSPHWNPAVEQQAIARIYRIGQLASKVDVFYFISTFDEKGTFTIDEYCLEIKRSKQEAIDYLFNYQDNA
jgi:SNF2 family DNA or RNA helicase